MLKKAGFVAAAAAGMMMIGGTAFASTTEAPAKTVQASTQAEDPSFGDAYQDFKEGGAAAGYGAASLVAGAYTGIALTPSLVAGSMAH